MKEIVGPWVFFTYRTMRDIRVRDAHGILDGVMLREADAWGSRHYPANGWRCRCKT